MKLGIDEFKENSGAVLKGRNFVLITGGSNVDSCGVPVYLTVTRSAPGQLKAIWSLQHGFFIDKQDNMILSDSFFWKEMDIEIKSLYGEALLPGESWLEGVDALVIDLFDVGTRVYTFVNHIVQIMKHLSRRNIDLIVLDRPNPLNGLGIEGNVSEEDYFSIVGRLPVPMRHALTTGEFLSYALNYYNIDLQLEVVTVKDWKRKDSFNGIWTYPSPNMPTFRTAVVYPGAVLLEGTGLSEGRGTTRPFEFVGAPFIDNFKWVRQLENLNLKGVTFIPIFFKPEFSKFQGEVCKGILVEPGNLDEFNSFEVYYEIIRLVRNNYPDLFKWKEPPYEFEYHRPPIDMICGTAKIREAMETNRPYREIEPGIESGIQKYIDTIGNYLFY